MSVQYYVRVPLYLSNGTPVGYVQAPANDPQQYFYSQEFMRLNPALFSNVSGNWYHRDPETGDTTHPAHPAEF